MVSGATDACELDQGRARKCGHDDRRNCIGLAARALSLAMSLVLAACMVGPDFKSPDAPVAEQWLEAGDPSVRTDHQDYERWWTAFSDPTLSNLIDVAYRQNLTL